MLRPGSWCALHILISHQKPLQEISVHARCKRGRQNYHAFHYLVFLLCLSCSELPKNWQMQAQVQIQQRRWLGKSWLPSLSPGLAYCLDCEPIPVHLSPPPCSCALHPFPDKTQPNLIQSDQCTSKHHAWNKTWISLPEFWGNWSKNLQVKVLCSTALICPIFQQK